MNRTQCDSLRYKLIGIERDYKRGRCDDAITNLLRINLTLIGELYDTQQKLDALLDEKNGTPVT